MTVKNPGPSKKGDKEEREDLEMLNFKADKKTVEKLNRIIMKLSSRGVRRGRSAAIRWAIDFADAGLEKLETTEISKIK